MELPDSTFSLSTLPKGSQVSSDLHVMMVTHNMKLWPQAELFGKTFLVWTRRFHVDWHVVVFPLCLVVVFPKYFVSY